MQPLPVCIEASRAYQATRAYSTPPVFPERDERHTTNDYGLVHLAMNITKRHIFHAITSFLLPSEAVFVLQCRKVFVVQVDQAAEAEVHRHLQALQHSRAAFPSPPPASNLCYWHYLQQLTEVLAGRPPKGFRFAVTKAADEQAPRGMDKDIYYTARLNRLNDLLDLCQEWAGHAVIDTYKEWTGCNALMIAAELGHEVCVCVLIAANVDMEYADNHGRTALHWAALYNRASTCRVLVDEGASLTAVDRDGKTPFECAKKKNHAECVAVLKAAAVAAAAAEAKAKAQAEATVAALPRGFRFAVTKAADEQAPHGVDKQIFDAARQGKLVKLLGLCQQWAGHTVVNACNDDVGGDNALLAAAWSGHDVCVRVLIAANTNLAYASSNGWTALHYAAMKGHASTCRVLIDEGASLTAVDRKNKTPLKLAKTKGGNAESIAILEDAAEAAEVTEEAVPVSKAQKKKK